MDASECIATKLDVREFSTRHVAGDLKLKVLDAARMAGTGMNTQHWRFIVVQDGDALKRLAADSSTGAWVGNAAFAVIVLTDPKYGFHLIDAGRAVQNMQIAAWNDGVVSCIYTGIKEDALRRDFGIPNELRPTVVVGFGYPTRQLTGRRKNRKPLEEVTFLEKYGHRLGPAKAGRVRVVAEAAAACGPITPSARAAADVSPFSSNVAHRPSARYRRADQGGPGVGGRDGSDAEGCESHWAFFRSGT